MKTDNGLPALVSFRTDDPRRSKIKGESQWHCVKCGQAVCVSPSSLAMYSAGKWRDVICAQCAEAESGQTMGELVRTKMQPEQVVEILRELFTEFGGDE